MTRYALIPLLQPLLPLDASSRVALNKKTLDRARKLNIQYSSSPHRLGEILTKFFGDAEEDKINFERAYVFGWFMIHRGATEFTEIFIFSILRGGQR